MNRIILLTLFLLLTACAPKAAIPRLAVELTRTPFAPARASALPADISAPPTLTPVPPTPTDLPTDIPIAIPTNTPTIEATEYPSSACGWNWAHQALPELSAEFLGKFQAAGLPVETARAEAYGENCLAQDGSVVRFAVMETDFYLTLTATDLDDETTLGNLLDRAITVLDQFPNDQTPGPQPGYVGLTFKAGEQVQNLWFQQTRLAELRAQGLSGADLYRALKN